MGSRIVLYLNEVWLHNILKTQSYINKAQVTSKQNKSFQLNIEKLLDVRAKIYIIKGIITGHIFPSNIFLSNLQNV